MPLVERVLVHADGSRLWRSERSDWSVRRARIGAHFMHKTGRPWYRRGKDSWYVWHAGQQVFLAKGKKNKAEAFARFAEILDAEPGHGSGAATTIGELVDGYMVQLKVRIKRTTMASY